MDNISRILTEFSEREETDLGWISGKVKDLNIDLQSKKVILESELSDSELIKLFDNAGYDAEAES